MKELLASQKNLWDAQHKRRRPEHKDIADKPNNFANECLKYIPDGAMVLELGAASGRDARYFAREKKCKVFALDFSLTALNHLQEDALTDGSANFVQPINADINHIPLLGNNTLDAIYARSSLHISDSDLERLLTKMLEMLKNNGYLMIEGKIQQDPKIQNSESVANNLATDSSGHLRRVWDEEYVMEHIINKFNLKLIKLDLSHGQTIDEGGRYINFIAQKNGKQKH